jgi:hypothetical protein
MVANDEENMASKTGALLHERVIQFPVCGNRTDIAADAKDVKQWLIIIIITGPC